MWNSNRRFARLTSNSAFYEPFLTAEFATQYTKTGQTKTKQGKCRSGIRHSSHRSIVQIVGAQYIAALELDGSRGAGRLKVVKAEGTEARNRIENLKDDYVVKEDANPLFGGEAGSTT